MMRAAQLTVSWNCRNLRMLLNTERPHSTVLTIEEKLSSRMMMSEASLATSVPTEGSQKIGENNGEKENAHMDM